MYHVCRLYCITFTAALLAGCGGNSLTLTTNLPVAATFYPVAFLLEQVGGEHVSVALITPAGTEPHDFEPTPKDIAAIERSALLVGNGNGVDGWAEKIAPTLEASGVRTLFLSNTIAVLPGHGEEGGAAPTHDPHVWLDPNLFAVEADAVRAALTTIDPPHAEDYKKNADIFILKLKKLDEEYARGLSQCKEHTIVTTHNAFSYLAKRYGLSTDPIAGLSPDEEPSPAAMAAVIEHVRAKKISTVFFESLVSSKLAETIAGETNAGTAVLDPIEGITETNMRAGDDYFVVMRRNLTALRTALRCP